MSAMLHAVVPFFVVFIGSRASTTMAMTTTAPVTVVSSGTSSDLSTITMAPSLMGLPVTSGQHDVVLPPPLTLRHSGGVVGLATVQQQQTSSQMPLQAYANYAMGPPELCFTFRVEPPTMLYFYMFGVCSGVCFLLSGAMLGAIFTYGPQPLGFAPLQPFEAYLWQAYVQPGSGHLPTQGMHRVAAPSTALSRGNVLLLIQLAPSHSNYLGIQLWGLSRVTQFLHLPCMVVRGLHF